MTVLELISASLRKLGVLGAGETCPPGDSADALVALNNLIDQLLTIERLGIYTTTRTTWTITSGQRDYTIGVAAANQLVNGDCEVGFYTPSGGSQTIPLGWSASFAAGTTGTIVQGATIHGGTASVGLAVAGAGEVVIAQRVPATVSQGRSVSYWCARNVAADDRAYVYNPTTAKYLQSNGTWSASANPFLSANGAQQPAFAQGIGTFTTESASVTELELRLSIYSTGGGNKTLFFDDMSFGPTYSINIARPPLPEAIRVGYIDTSQTNPIEIPLNLLTEDGWANVMMKDFESNFPQQVYYNPTYPNGMLSLRPTPTSSTLTGVIYVPTPVGQFTTINETVSLPPGYLRMLIANLALEMAPDYDKSPHPALIEQARDSKAAVKRANRRLTDMSFDAGALIGNGGGWFNIWTGQ